VDTALVVACISAVVALASAAFSGWTQLQVSKREREGRLEERRSEAKVVLDRYRGPLLDAAWQLGDRVDNIRNRSFLAFLSNSSGRERDARLSTLFRFAYYLGWREYVLLKSSCCRLRTRRTPGWPPHSSTTSRGYSPATS